MTPDLWRILVMLRVGNPLVLTFTGENMAKKAYEMLNSTELPGFGGGGKVFSTTINDQYGNTLTVKPGDIVAVLLSHVSEDLAANTEIAFAQARANSAAQRRAQSDPTINSPIALPGSGMARA